jgi:hypothetical protein
VVDGSASDRVFDVAFGVAASLSGMTIRNGWVRPPVSPLGGGILVRVDGSLDLTECVVEGNRAEHGGGLNAFPGTKVSIVDSVFRDNRAQDSTHTLANGGAIFARGDVDLEGSTLSGNSADRDGGAIDSANGSLSLRNTTVSGNRAGLLAGGVTTSSTDVDLVNVTIYDNEGIGILAASPGSPTLSMKNSIIAASSHLDCAFGTVTLDVAGKHNLDSDGTCELNGLAGDLPNTDPMLDALLWNGGATLNHVPQRGSPVIDAGDNATCEAVDQRGAPRPLDGDGSGGTDVCDIGAVEVLPCVAPWNDDEELVGLTISGFDLCEACFTITAGPNFVVEGPNGLVVLKSRDAIILRDGFTVESGGTLQAMRDPAAGSGITLP